MNEYFEKAMELHKVGGEREKITAYLQGQGCLLNKCESL